MSSIQVAVIGNGAVGCALTQILADTGCSVHLIGRHGEQSAWPKLRSPDGALLSACSVKGSNFRRSQIVFLATKAFDLISAAESWLPEFSEVKSIVVLSNGYISNEVTGLAKKLTAIQIRQGAVTFGVRSIDGDYQLSDRQGKVFFGDMSGDQPLAEEVELLNLCNRLSWREDIAKVIKKKWIFNTVINSLCAKYCLDQNGKLKSHEKEVSAWLENAVQLADRIYPTVKIERENILGELWQLVESTSTNMNSMVQDIRSGRRTEHEYLAGVASNFTGFDVLKQWRPDSKELSSTSEGKSQ